jgi:hypothetical protein
MTNPARAVAQASFLKETIIILSIFPLLEHPDSLPGMHSAALLPNHLREARGGFAAW